jgi:hypothetical protein
MTEKHIFADVDLPFHVWVKEGCRWVLRDAAQRARTDEASYREPPTSPAPSPDAPPRP